MSINKALKQGDKVPPVKLKDFQDKQNKWRDLENKVLFKEKRGN